jgi:ABC-type arginine transport system permease subunit
MYRIAPVRGHFRTLVAFATGYREARPAAGTSAAAGRVGVYELTSQTQQIQSITYQGFEAFTAATVVYIVIALAVTLIMHRMESWTALPGTISGGVHVRF